MSLVTDPRSRPLHLHRLTRPSLQGVVGASLPGLLAPVPRLPLRGVSVAEPQRRS